MFIRKLRVEHESRDKRKMKEMHVSNIEIEYSQKRMIVKIFPRN